MWFLLSIPQISYQRDHPTDLPDETWFFSMAGTPRVNLLTARNGLLGALDGALDQLLDAEQSSKTWCCLKVSNVYRWQ